MSDEHQHNEPAAREPQATAGPERPENPSPGKADSARILILEDSAWDAELAQRLLRNATLSFSALVVETKASFIEQLMAFHPDVIISDFSLPGFTGADALRIVQEQCPDIPFICWSGALGDEAAVELIKQGATDYILKDRPARLPSAVDRAFTESRQRARLARIEGQLGQAQHLASLGHLRGAEEALSLTHQMLASVRRDAMAPDQGAPDK
jgi:DNA-binding NtrC family response regulator